MGRVPKEPKTKRPPPPYVQFARLVGDQAALSRLGRAGAMAKKEFAELDRLAEEEKKHKEQEKEELRKQRECTQRRKWWANSSKQMAREANEYICPID